MDQRYFRTKEIAPIFGFKPTYLEKLRSLRTGPKFIRIGGVVLYTIEWMEEWVQTTGEEVSPMGIY